MPLSPLDTLLSILAIVLGASVVFWAVRSIARARRAEEREPPPDRVASLRAGERRLRGRLRATGDSLLDARGEPCVLKRVRVVARVSKRKTRQVIDATESVAASFEDDTGTCAVDLSEAILRGTEDARSYGAAELASALPDLARQIEAMPDIPNKLRQRLLYSDRSKDKPFRVMQLWLPDESEVDIDAEVMLVPVGDGVEYRSAETTRVVRVSTVWVSVSHKKPPWSHHVAAILMTLLGALTIGHGLTLWILSVVLARAAR